MTDNNYMKLALELAVRGCGFVNPNPMVGAIIVKDGEMIGQGWHERFGELHAERIAIANCRKSPKGATIYVTLEPCCHYGKTPPCTEAIIESGITKVVVGSVDPNPLVAGKGVLILKQHGIDVVENVLKEECDKLNEVFFYYIKTGLPFVIMKYAMTMDGKIATYKGKSKWITGEAAREHVQQDRHKYTAIMVGVDTVIADDPQLTCRLKSSKNPIRIICDTNLRTPLTSQIVTTAQDVPTILAICSEDEKLHSPYVEAGCRILVVSRKGEHIDLNDLMIKLGNEKIDSILLEGGGTLNWSALKSGIVNIVQTYIAPKMFGGKMANSPVGGMGIEDPNDAFMLKNIQITQIREDILIESEVINNVYRNC